MAEKIKRVAIIGPESSGKSQLCSQLAIHYGTNRVDEYSRNYLSAIGHPYTLDDIVAIYTEQFKHEQNLLAESKKFIFIDTEFIIARVWCEHVFKTCPPYLDEMIRKNPYDLYLLTSPDLPWEYDPLRENPGKGNFFFEWYLRLLKQYGLNYGIVSGTGESRLQSAIDIINKQGW